jgi:rod shape-determining protein MreD
LPTLVFQLSIVNRQSILLIPMDGASLLAFRMMAVAVRREIEVYRVHPVVMWVSVFVALLLQTVLPIKIPLARLFDFPLLVTIYFSLLRRSKVFGTLFGTALGLLQDALSHGWVGMSGMANAMVGYMAASASFRFDFDRLMPRLLLTALCLTVHGLFLAGLRAVLLDPPPTFHPLDLASVLLVNVALAIIVFQILDRFKTLA